MKSNTNLVTVFGGSGFVGRYVVRELAKRGYRVRVAVRRPDLAFHLQPLGDLGQIKAAQANIRYPKSIESAVAGANHVINLVGTFDASGKNNYDAVQAEGAKAIAKAAANHNAKLIHVSAIGADANSESGYAKSKATGEKSVFRAIKDAIIFRPSVIFGKEDQFFNRFAAMATISPFLPLIGGGKTKFQPVYVGDVALAIANAVDGNVQGGKIYELGGPRIASFRECLDLMQEIIDRKKSYISLPWFLAKAKATLIGWIPGAPITPDQVKLLRNDTIVSEKAIRENRTLEGIGIKPRQMKAILPTYLVRFRPSGQFTRKGEI